MYSIAIQDWFSATKKGKRVWSSARDKWCKQFARLSWVRWDRNWQFKPQLWRVKTTEKWRMFGTVFFFNLLKTSILEVKDVLLFNERVAKMDFKEQIMHCPVFSIFWGNNCQHVLERKSDWNDSCCLTFLVSSYFWTSQQASGKRMFIGIPVGLNPSGILGHFGFQLQIWRLLHGYLIH